MQYADQKKLCRNCIAFCVEWWKNGFSYTDLTPINGKLIMSVSMPFTCIIITIIIGVSTVLKFKMSVGEQIDKT